MYKGKLEEPEENFLILSNISGKGDGKSFNPMLAKKKAQNPPKKTPKNQPHAGKSPKPLPRQGNGTDFQKEREQNFNTG